MKKIARLFLPVLLCLFCFAFPVSADEYDQYDFTYPYVVDDAGLIDNDEQLSDRLNDIGSKYDVDIVIVTVDSLGGKTATEFADDFYDYNGYYDDGILFLISMEDRDWAISTKGSCIADFDDVTQSEIISEMRSSLSADDFETAFDIFADCCEDTLHSAKVMGIVIPLVIAVVVGLIAALIVTMVLKHQLTSVNFQKNANSYVERNSVRITQNQNIFLYKTLSKTKKESSSSGGGSSTHTSSSGSTHGGSSGKF
ncbi:MAG: TPM domain-containing protein [Oscillospiraceae bacterium]|nr:TPM domain-containing protein [Oscillospiraceae bacterium]